MSWYRHGIFSCMFSICNAMTCSSHRHRFSCAAMPYGGCEAPIHSIGALSFWSFGRIDGNEAALPRCGGRRWLGRCQFLFAGAYFSVALLSSPSAHAPPMAEARDNTSGPCVRIRHVPIHNKERWSVCSSIMSCIQNQARCWLISCSLECR